MVITINGLSEKSLRDAADKVRKLQKRYENKNREFVRELLKAGISVGQQHLSGAGDSTPPDFNSPHVMMGESGGVMRASLILRGEDVAFVEFGAGVHYNGHPNDSPHPLGAELGFTIGSYGQGHGLEEYWCYTDDNGVFVVSYGTEATMPLYHAEVAIKQEFVSIAKRVFGS